YRRRRRLEDEERIGAGVLQLEDLRAQIWRPDVVGLLVDDHFARFRPQPLGQTVEVILSIIIILIDHTDLGIRRILHDVLRVNERLALIDWLPTERVGEFLEFSGERCRSRRDKYLRHFLAVQVIADRSLGLRAETAERNKYLVLLDELLGQRHGLCGGVRVWCSARWVSPGVNPPVCGSGGVGVPSARARGAGGGGGGPPPRPPPIPIAQQTRHSTARHSQHHQQQDALDGARCGVGQVLAERQQQLLRVDGQKLGEQTTDQRAADGADATYHRADEQRNRKLERKR